MATSKGETKSGGAKARNPMTGKAVEGVVKKPRRTQAERVAETQAKIIEATVAYIDEKGFHQTSLHQVAKKAKVTVGAVQHHYASKADLLTAVVEDCFYELSKSLEGLNLSSPDLEERIGLFIDSCWEFCDSPRYHAAVEILLGMRSETADNFESWLSNTLGQLTGGAVELWKSVIGDVGMEEGETFDLLLYVFSSLTGSSLLHRISVGPERPQRDLEELKTLLTLRLNNQVSQKRRKKVKAAS